MCDGLGRQASDKPQIRCRRTAIGAGKVPVSAINRDTETPDDYPKPHDAGSIVRIPAREIEELAAARIAAFLKDAGQVIDELAGSLAPRDQERLIAAAGIQAERWPRMAASERRGFT